MISTMAAVAEGVTNEFCFDCPAEHPFIDAETVAFWLGLSLVLSIPGFFAGMVIQRKLARVPLIIRSLIVAAFVPVFWIFLLGYRETDLFWVPVLTASLLTAFASYFDGRRVDTEVSLDSFSEY